MTKTDLDPEGALSRDPVVPRGAVVAGEDRGVEGGAGEGELPVVAWRTRARAGDGYVDCAPGPWELHYSEPARNPLNYDKEPLTPLLPAQERIRALEEERDTLQLSLQDGKKVIAELESRLRDAVGALSPDGEWVKEGEV